MRITHHLRILQYFIFNINFLFFILFFNQSVDRSNWKRGGNVIPDSELDLIITIERSGPRIGNTSMFIYFVV
jgi:hypothetical protein